MRCRFLALLVGVAAACSKQVPEEVIGATWQVVETPNIRLETDLPLRYATLRATTLENELRALIYLYQLLSPKPAPELRPIHVILFDDCDTYRAVGGRQDAKVDGYARRSFDLQDTLVVITCDDVVETPGLAPLVRNMVFRHELSHVLNDYYFGALPVWLNEGLAEYFGAAELRDDVAVLGHPPIDHTWSAASRDRPPLDDLRSKPWKVEMASYQAAWTAAHALLNSSFSSRDRAERYLLLLASGTGEAVAWREAVGPVEAEVRKTYAEWKASEVYKTWTIPLAPGPAFEQRSRSMSPAEVAARLVEIAIFRSGADETFFGLRGALADLRRADGDRGAAELWQAIAAFYTEDRALGDPTALFADCVRQNPDDPRARFGWFLSSVEAAAETAASDERHRLLESLETSLGTIVQRARSPYELSVVARYWLLVDKPMVALPFLRRALSLEPGCTSCYQSLAAARFALKQYPGAVAAQERALSSLGDRQPRPEMLLALEFYRAAAAPAASP